VNLHPGWTPTQRRIGKWTTEEENYARKIIEYFNTGRLELPEGATLRAVVANAVSCDPMRVTKKIAIMFPGAAPMGKKVYRPSEFKHVVPEEIALAKQDLEHLHLMFKRSLLVLF